MQAIVLVGGLGTRLLPLTEHIPKQMLPVAGSPIIERVLANLARHGVDHVVLSLGHLAAPFESAYPTGVIAGVAVTFAVEPTALDTAGAVRFAAHEAGIDETFLAVNGDNLTDLDITGLVDLHRTAGAQGTIALTPVADPSAYGVVVTDATGLVETFVEKPPAGTAPTNEVNAGTYVFEPHVLDRIDPSRPVSLEREVFPQMVAERVLFARADDAYWLDLGTPASYLQANLDVLCGAHAAPTAAPIERGCLRGARTAVASTATVTDSVLGDDVIVGDGAVVEHSVVLDGATVARGATVRQSIVGPGATVEHGASLDELCVVAMGATVPSTSSLRGARVI